VLAELVGQYTYVGIFLTLVAAGFGAPVPEEVPIALAGAMAGRGLLGWWPTFAVCIAGVVAGDTALYLIGRCWGPRVLSWRATRWVLTAEREARLLGAYRRWGLAVVLVARFVVGMRAAAFLTAGIARIPFPPFIVVDASAALVSVTLALGAGYALAISQG
jgi:membrane protein DedA with SNARE-associated domain